MPLPLTHRVEVKPLPLVHEKAEAFPLTRKKGEAHTALVYDREGKVIGLKNETVVTAQEAFTAISAKLRDINSRLADKTDQYREIEEAIFARKNEIRTKESETGALSGSDLADAEERIAALKQDAESREAELEVTEKEIDGLSEEAKPWIAFSDRVHSDYLNKENEADQARAEEDEIGGGYALVIDNPFYKEGGEHVPVATEERFDQNASYDTESLVGWQEKFFDKRKALKDRLAELEGREQGLVKQAGEIAHYDEPLRTELKRKEIVAKKKWREANEAERAHEEGRVVTSFGQEGMRKEMKEAGISEQLADINDEMQDILTELKHVNDDIVGVQKRMAGGE